MKYIYKSFCYICLYCLIDISTINAQNYLIDFKGSAASTLVSSVKIENLTKGTSLTLSGTDILRLTSISSISSLDYNPSSNLIIYPNPIFDKTTFEFKVPAEGESIISIVDITGRTIFQNRYNLVELEHSFKLSGLKSGFYFISIKGNDYHLTGILVSNADCNGNITIEKLQNTVQHNIEEPKSVSTKGTSGTVDMAYTNGDRLKFTGTSGKLSTVKMDIPTSDKTIVFNFIDCTDGDNNSYPIVEIGNQIWMAENLKTTKYRNGALIPGTENINWQGNTSGAYCWYNNESINKNSYGGLYNYYAVSNEQQLCPTGWHIPSDQEWTILTQHFSNDICVGDKLKETGTINWNSPNNGSTNESGFSARPGGYRDYPGTFYGIGDWTKWWSSDESSVNAAWTREVANGNCAAGRSGDAKYFGFSVRCLKDKKVQPEEAYPGMIGPALEFIINGDTIICRKINNQYVWQGDVILTEEQLFKSDTTKGAGGYWLANRWPNNLMYYTIEGDVIFQNNIITAINIIQNRTNVRFEQWINQKNYVIFKSSTGSNSSNIGMIGGAQNINLDQNAPQGTIMHEIFHALGLIHEHVRWDRDEYIKIYWENMDPYFWKDFKKMRVFWKTEFDYNSVMMYPCDTKSMTDNPTMTKLDNTTWEWNRETLTSLDAQVINEMYPVHGSPIPTVETSSPEFVNNSVMLGGQVLYTAGTKILERGVYYGTMANTELNGTKFSIGGGFGQYTSAVPTMNQNTLYYFRAYAINSQGIGYGKEMSFTSPQGLAPIANFSANPTTITAGETVHFSDLSTNNPSIWSWNFGDGYTSPEPSPDHTYSTAGVYNVTLTVENGFGSNSRTINNCITVNQKPSDNGIIFNPNLTYGTVSDVEGNVYKTIQIGTQTWMAENLRTTKYNDGSNIPLITDNATWSTLSTPAFCWYNNDASAYKSAYGALYNWYTLNNNKLCPSGWHVPTYDEWTTLSTYVGGAGGQLKETSCAHWTPNNGICGATNQTGFTALAGGWRFSGTFERMGEIGVWWSATDYTTDRAWKLSLGYNNLFINIDNYRPKQVGNSVRCVKD